MTTAAAPPGHSPLFPAAAPRRRRTVLQMAAGGTLTLLLTRTALSWFRSALIARSAPRYQPVTSLIMHALTDSFFTNATWFIAAGLALAQPGEDE